MPKDNKKSKLLSHLVVIIIALIIGFFIGRSFTCPPQKDCPELSRSDWIHEHDLRTVLDNRNSNG